MKIALVQYNPVWEDKHKNREQIYTLMKGISESVSLSIFPELTLTGFTMRSRSFAESADGKSVKFFQQIAVEFNTHICAGFIESENNNFYNSLVHITPDKQIQAKYRKVHPFSFSGEQRFYSSGEIPVVSAVEEWSIGLSICYDLRFPELFRQYAKKRTEILLNIANWPEPRIDHWSKLLTARAIENQAFMIGVNRVGRDKKNNYTGRSAVIDPFGVKICELADAEEIRVIEIEKSGLNAVREKYPFLDDMRLV